MPARTEKMSAVLEAVYSLFEKEGLSAAEAQYVADEMANSKTLESLYAQLEKVPFKRSLIEEDQ